MDQVHYFTDNRNLSSNRREISFRFSGYSYVFTSDTGVFSKNQVDYGTTVLLTAISKEDIKGKVLDLGCGYGTIGIVTKKLFPQIDILSSDINSRAVDLAKINYERNSVSGNTIVSDGFQEITEKFDWVLLNPPIRTGKDNIYYMFDEAYHHLNGDGKLVIVIRRKQGAESAIRHLEAVYDGVDILLKEKGYWVVRATRAN